MPRYKSKKIQAEYEKLVLAAHRMDRLGQAGTSHHERLIEFKKQHARKSKETVIKPQEKEND